MKKLIILVAILLSSVVGKTVDSYVKELENLSNSQKNILFYSVHKGIENGMGLKLAAIVGKESEYGRNLVNKGDGGSGSYGPYQILLKYSKKRNKAKTREEIENLKYRLKHDIHFSSDEAITVYKEWEEYHKKKERAGQELAMRTVASYNGGGNISDAAMRYANDIAVREKAIEKYIKKKVSRSIPDMLKLVYMRYVVANGVS